MQRLTSAFLMLDPLRRGIVAAATIAVFVAILAIARGTSTPSMTLLYSGLGDAASGDVIASLEQSGVAFDVRGDAIYVESAARDRTRMTLAAEGKPINVTAGYEILDGLSGFGTTSQMFDAAYWRAKEGELARTILASPTVENARVHISRTGQDTFARNVTASASVTVVTSGPGISRAQARAMKYLVASAVPGLAVEDVAIIDAEAGVVQAGQDAGSAMSPLAGDRAVSLKRNVERLLEARVGRGRAIVEVNVDTVTESEQIVERTLDPDSRVAISTVTEETSSSALDARRGPVTVASNLPEGDTGNPAANSTSQDTETREQVNYEVSEIQREIMRAPGAIRRISVAVLVDGLRAPDEAGAIAWRPRPEPELEALRELVASAVGFDADRGDTITLQSLEFPNAEPKGSAPTPIPVSRQLGLDPMRAIQIGALASVIIVLGLFVLRPLLMPARGTARPEDTAPGLPPPETSELRHSMIYEGPVDARPQEDDTPPRSTAMAVVGPDDEIPIQGPGTVDRLKSLTETNGSQAASVLRSWMEDRGASA